MIVREMGAISRLAKNFNDLPRENAIRGIRGIAEFESRLAEKELAKEEDMER